MKFSVALMAFVFVAALAVSVQAAPTVSAAGQLMPVYTCYGTEHCRARNLQLITFTDTTHFTGIYHEYSLENPIHRANLFYTVNGANTTLIANDNIDTATYNYDIYRISALADNADATQIYFVYQNSSFFTLRKLNLNTNTTAALWTSAAIGSNYAMSLAQNLTTVFLRWTQTTNYYAITRIDKASGATNNTINTANSGYAGNYVESSTNFITGTNNAIFAAQRISTTQITFYDVWTSNALGYTTSSTITSNNLGAGTDASFGVRAFMFNSTTNAAIVFASTKDTGARELYVIDRNGANYAAVTAAGRNVYMGAAFQTSAGGDVIVTYFEPELDNATWARQICLAGGACALTGGGVPPGGGTGSGYGTNYTFLAPVPGADVAALGNVTCSLGNQCDVYWFYAYYDSSANYDYAVNASSAGGTCTVSSGMPSNLTYANVSGYFDYIGPVINVSVFKVTFIPQTAGSIPYNITCSGLSAPANQYSSTVQAGWNVYRTSFNQPVLSVSAANAVIAAVASPDLAYDRDEFNVQVQYKPRGGLYSYPDGTCFASYLERFSVAIGNHSNGSIATSYTTQGGEANLVRQQLTYAGPTTGYITPYPFYASYDYGTGFSLGLALMQDGEVNISCYREGSASTGCMAMFGFDPCLQTFIPGYAALCAACYDPTPAGVLKDYVEGKVSNFSVLPNFTATCSDVPRITKFQISSPYSNRLVFHVEASKQSTFEIMGNGTDENGRQILFSDSTTWVPFPSDSWDISWDAPSREFNNGNFTVRICDYYCQSNCNTTQVNNISAVYSCRVNFTGDPVPVNVNSGHSTCVQEGADWYLVSCDANGNPSTRRCSRQCVATTSTEEWTDYMCPDSLSGKSDWITPIAMFFLTNWWAFAALIIVVILVFRTKRSEVYTRR